MDFKKNIKKEIEFTLKKLHQKIDCLKEKVEELCEITNCFIILCDKNDVNKVNPINPKKNKFS